jgi:hypothetical protein
MDHDAKDSKSFAPLKGRAVTPLKGWAVTRRSEADMPGSAKYVWNSYLYSIILGDINIRPLVW